MKKKLIPFFLLIISINLHAQNWDFFYELDYAGFTEKTYKTVTQSELYNKQQKKLDIVNSNQIFQSSKAAWIQDESVEPYEIFDHMIKYGLGWISADNLVLDNSDVLPEEIITNKSNRNDKRWIPIWYNELLTSGKKLEDYSDWYKRYKNVQEVMPLSQLHTLEFRNTFLTMYDAYGIYCYSIKNIKQKNNVYYLYCELEDEAESHILAFNDESFSNIPDISENQEVLFIIEKNGNRLRVYNGQNNKLIIELMQVNKELVSSMIKYINSSYKSKDSNLFPIAENLKHSWSNIITGTYIEESNNILLKTSSNIVMNKIMTVKENLKLRSGEATSTQVLTVMSAGTKVKILEIGKDETIDGIKSNWVKVEIISGNDRDGNKLKVGMTGWFYGGYLE